MGLLLNSSKLAPHTTNLLFMLKIFSKLLPLVKNPKELICDKSVSKYAIPINRNVKIDMIFKSLNCLLPDEIITNARLSITSAKPVREPVAKPKAISKTIATLSFHDFL